MYKPRYKQLKERKTFKDHKTKNFENFFNKKVLAANWPGLERPNLAKMFINLQNLQSLKIRLIELFKLMW